MANRAGAIHSALTILKSDFFLDLQKMTLRVSATCAGNSGLLTEMAWTDG